MTEVVEKPKKDASRFFAENSVKESHVEQSPRTNAFQDILRQEVFQQYTNFYDSKKMENKPLWRKWQFLAAGTFAFVVVATGLAAVTLTGNGSEKKLSAEVAYVEGDFEYLQDGDVWADASQDMTIVEGDSVRISGEGRAIINLDDGSSVRLASDSTVKLSSMDPENIVISNEEGEVYTRVVKADRSFKVETGDTYFESLGTAYKTINTEDKNGVFVYHSEVAVKDSADDKVVVKEGSKYFVKNDSEDEKEVIKLTEKDIEDEFTQWNKEQDEKEFKDELGVLSDKGSVEGETEETDKEDEEAKEEQDKEDDKVATSENKPKTNNTAPTTQSASISLSSVTPHSYGKFKVQWNASGDTSQGFKVIYNTGGNPSYPNDNPVYIGDSGQRSATVSGLAAGTYYVRVCRYTGSGCDSYSNQMQVTVESQPSISSVSVSYSSGKLTWTTNTGTTGNGFKIVKNDVGTPTYPDNAISYIDGFNFTPTENGFYRICAWDGGSGCTAYSNQIEVTDK